jgi:hypothetical protein
MSISGIIVRMHGGTHMYDLLSPDMIFYCILKVFKLPTFHILSAEHSEVYCS